jgi:predicted signal transduction protein with EAL and GGDEF domain
VTLSGSIGISVFGRERTRDADELIRDADAAMYIAKRDGKSGYRLFEPAMHEGVRRRLELRTDLQRALATDQFELHYQPVDPPRGRLRVRRRGAAALAHPEQGPDLAGRVHPDRRGDRA